MNLEDFLNLPNTRTDEEKKDIELFFQKMEEYEKHFGCSDIITEGVLGVSMTKEEIIENIDKCIKHNRKWNGFIVPELDYSEVDI